MMLNHIGTTRKDDVAIRCAASIRDAYNLALTEGQKTRDLGGELGCNAFADAVIDRLKG